MLEFLSSEFDLAGAEPFDDPGRKAVDSAIAAAKTAAGEGDLQRLLTQDDVLRLAASALADLRDFALSGSCPEAEAHLDAAIETLCEARDRISVEVRNLAAD